MRRALFAVAAMLLLAGCRAAPRGVTIIASVPCLPPGVRGDFFGWPVVAFQPIVLRQEAGDDATEDAVGHGPSRTLLL